MRDPHKKKARDLRRKVRGGGQNPSGYNLFWKYHPELEEIHNKLHWCDPGWMYVLYLKHEWINQIAGYWNAVGGAPPSWYRRMWNRTRRARQKAAWIRAEQNNDLEDFALPRDRRNIRWLWW